MLKCLSLGIMCKEAPEACHAKMFKPRNNCAKKVQRRVMLKYLSLGIMCKEGSEACYAKTGHSNALISV